jgi:uncharacterized delta-60 repeat protein
MTEFVRFARSLLFAAGLSSGGAFFFDAAASPGGLDPSFDYNGIMKTDFGTTPGMAGFPLQSRDELVQTLALQPDECIVAGGTSNGDFALARYLPNGGLDSSFGNGGRVVTDLGTEQDNLVKVFVLGDGRILAVGGCVYRIGMVRYLSNGALDPSFGVDGKLLVAFDGGVDAYYSPYPFSAVMQPDGKIVVGLLTGRDSYVVRLNSDGSPDTTFGAQGKFLFESGFQFYNAFNHAIRDILCLPDGKILLGGFRNANGVLVRLLPDGTTDPTFGAGGEVSTISPFYMALQNDGKIVTLGTGWAGGQSPYALCVARMNADGTMDGSFGDQGKVLQDFGTAGPESRPDPKGLEIGNDGRIFAVGDSIGGQWGVIGVACYLPNGTPDETFGSGGKVLTRFTPQNSGTMTRCFVYTAILQNDDKLIIGGELESLYSTTGSDFMVARFLMDNSASSVPFLPEVNLETADTSDAQPVGRHSSLRKLSKTSRGPVTIEVTVRNFGTDFDTFGLRGNRMKKQVRVRYSQDKKNITNVMASGKFVTPQMSPEDVFSFEAKIIPTKKLRRKFNMRFIISAKSGSDSTSTNAASVRLTFRPRP